MKHMNLSLEEIIKTRENILFIKPDSLLKTFHSFFSIFPNQYYSSFLITVSLCLNDCLHTTLHKTQMLMGAFHLSLVPPPPPSPCSLLNQHQYSFPITDSLLQWLTTSHNVYLDLLIWHTTKVTLFLKIRGNRWYILHRIKHIKTVSCCFNFSLHLEESI